MSTTIQVSETTHRLLKNRKVESKKTFDQIISDLLEATSRLPRSMAGAFPNLKSEKQDWLKSEYD